MKMKRNMKKLSCLLLAVVMLIGVLAGCASKNGSTDTPGTNDTNNPGTNGNSKPGTDNPGKDIPTLKVWGFGYTATTEDRKAVSEAISAITREKIGVNVDIFIAGDGEALNLAMNSGEEWDLVNYHAFSGGLTAMVSTGLVQPIDDLVYQYGQEMIDKLGEEYLTLGKVGDHLYSVPGRTQIVANAYGLFLRKDYMDEVGADVNKIKSFDEMHDVLLQIKAKHPDMAIIIPTWGGGGMQKAFAWDNLSTGFWDGLGILESCHDSSTKVVNMYETESYTNFVNNMYKWKQDGLLMADGATSAEGGDSIIKNGKGVGLFNNFSKAKEDQAKTVSVNWGTEVVIWQFVDPFVTSDAGGNSMVIPTSCKRPELAMQLWNLMATDPEIDNILCNGVEGMHYDYTDDTKQCVKFRDGCTWDYNYFWGWPNGKDMVLREGDDPGALQREAEIFATASNSPAMGFKFDSADVTNEITACNNVIAKYETAMRWGELDPAEALPKLNQELYAAGLQTIIDAKQAQLDAFLGK